ncbi:MAG TPA: tetratricopeptide repeat protein [Candidatus Bathyarchaeia archaeon]|nr:tetratricopeptide repeat protein [Candidatus Bathyarchaeia archaeon]
MDSSRILESWKEISSYLNRDVRTCQRWERELGLPIHRLEDSPKARIFAYAHELDRWLEQKLHERERQNGGLTELITTRGATLKLSRKASLALVLAFLALIGLSVVLWLLGRSAGTGLRSSASRQPTLAVLFFTNDSGDAGLDHWREGLAELLNASLSQSKSIEVVTGDEMYTVLKKLGLSEAGRYSSDEIVKIAMACGATHALSGRFIKAGGRFIITARLKKPGTVEQDAVLRLEADGESNIIPKVDDLTHWVLARLDFTEAQIRHELEKEAGRVTTSSPEALKYYIDGQERTWQLAHGEAIPYLEKAVELDPDFAMAYRSLGVKYSILGYTADFRRCFKKALALSVLLPENEKFFIQGQALCFDEDYPQGIAVLKKLVKEYPGHAGGQVMLGLAYNAVGEVGSSIRRLEAALEIQRTPLVVGNLAREYLAGGLYQKAEDICRSFLADVEENYYLHYCLIDASLYAGKFDAALAEAEKCYLLRPDLQAYVGHALVYKGDLAGAERVYRQVCAKGLPGKTSCLWCLALMRGQYQEALRLTRQLQEEAKGSKEGEARAYRLQARTLEKAGRYDEALQAEARSVKLAEDFRRTAGESELPYLPSERKSDLFLKGRLQAERGSFEEALATAQELAALVGRGINGKELRWPEYIQGQVEVGRGNYRKAADLFKRAVGRLDLAPDRVEDRLLFYERLGRSLYEFGDLNKARETYETITLRTIGRLDQADIYAKAFYMLGKIDERKGDRARAIEECRRFLDLWKDADPGLPEVADAAKALATLEARTSPPASR